MDSSLPNSTPTDLLCTRGNSTPMDLLSARERLRLEREGRATARLQRRRQRDRKQRRSEQPEVRQARLDRQCERNHERRTAEQPEAKRARLDRQCERDNEHRTAEQPEAKRARVDRQRERDNERRTAEQPEARQDRLARQSERNYSSGQKKVPVSFSYNDRCTIDPSCLLRGLTCRQINSLSSCHKFSMGLASGDSGGVVHQLTPLVLRNSLARFDTCFGSLSCMKRCPSGKTSRMNGKSVWSKMST